jgi:biopolymer transport protein ExbD
LTICPIYPILNDNIPQRMRHTLLALCTFFLIAARGQDKVDATALVFMIHHDSITIRVNHWSLTTLDTAELNRFVDQHVRSIDPNKIIVYGDAAAEYPTFKPIIDVLKKHDWLKFKLQPTGPATKASPPKNSPNPDTINSVSKFPKSSQFTILMSGETIVYGYTGPNLQNGMIYSYPALTKRLTANRSDSDFSAVIKPDSSVSYRSIVDMLDEMKRTGVTHYALVDITNEEKAYLRKIKQVDRL